MRQNTPDHVLDPEGLAAGFKALRRSSSKVAVLSLFGTACNGIMGRKMVDDTMSSANSVPRGPSRVEIHPPACECLESFEASAGCFR